MIAASKNTKPFSAPPTVIRCAIYTRKSTEEGLEQEFNSLDAQRESAEAYIASQKSQGWICLPDRYDDGGFSGGNMDRPAFQRMMSDIEAEKIDCIVVYKVDRLSRSLIDFAKIMDVLERKEVSFVSVTQQFNTTNSMGRLTLNILLSFAQFEREIISERTRDKIAAAKRKGRWMGGIPLLGYDRDPQACRLIVNEDEAAKVREIFELYLEKRSLLSTVQELEKRGWQNKEWQTSKGRKRGGRRFDKTSLFSLLRNVTYIGKIAYKDEVHQGLHAAIVSEELFNRVQQLLHHNNRGGGKDVRNKHGALLKGLLRCKSCDSAMSHAYTARGNKRYRYYVCNSAQKRGWDTCPTKSIPAGEIERFVVDHIRSIGQDKELVARTLQHARSQVRQELEKLLAEQQLLQRQLKRHDDELRRIIADGGANASAALAVVQDKISAAQRRAMEVREQIAIAGSQEVDEQDLATVMAMFDPVWNSLSPRQQADVVRLLVEKVSYDGRDGTVAVTFRPTGIKTLAKDFRNQVQEVEV